MAGRKRSGFTRGPGRPPGAEEDWQHIPERWLFWVEGKVEIDEATDREGKRLMDSAIATLKKLGLTPHANIIKEDAAPETASKRRVWSSIAIPADEVIATIFHEPGRSIVELAPLIYNRKVSNDYYTYHAPWTKEMQKNAELKLRVMLRKLMSEQRVLRRYKLEAGRIYTAIFFTPENSDANKHPETRSGLFASIDHSVREIKGPAIRERPREQFDYSKLDWSIGTNKHNTKLK